MATCCRSLPEEMVVWEILAFDHRAATDHDKIHTVVQLDEAFRPEASCDGLLVLSKVGSCGSCLSICNPATREHALPGPTLDLGIMGIYPHHPTGEYRLLLQQRMCGDLSPKDQVGCYVFALGSDQPPRYIGWPETASGIFNIPVLVRDSLHWYSSYYNRKSNPQHNMWENKLIAFDTIAESFRQIRGPVVPCDSHIFEMDGTLGICTRNRSTEVIDIWVLGNYEREVWELKYQVKLPVAEIRMKFEENCNEFWDLDVEDYGDYKEFDVVSVDSGALLLAFSRWLLHVDCDGKLVNNFYRGCRGGDPRISGCWLKQSLVQHTFFPALEGYVVNAPFVEPAWWRL